MPAQPVKCPLPVKPSAAAITPKPPGRPPTPASFEEALQQWADIEKRLDEFKDIAKQDMEEALKWGDDKAIQKADYSWRIMTTTINDIQEENRVFNEPSLVEQMIYGKEEKRGKTAPKKLMSVISINCGINSKTCTPTKRAKILSPPDTSWLDSRMKKKKTNYYYIWLLLYGWYHQ